MPRIRRKMTPSESGQWAAMHRWAKEDPTLNATRGQRGLQAKYLRQVDEHAATVGETLTEAERQRRAEVRYRLHMRAIRLGIPEPAPSEEDGQVV